MRKNIFRTFLAAALFSAVLTVSAFAESAVVTGDGVNMRSGPGTNYGIVACLEKGTGVTVNDRSNSSWYSVTYNGTTGFMSSSYLSITNSTSADVVQSSGTAYVNANYVRFRSGPGSGYSILGEYSTGKTVTVTGVSGSWTQCTIDGKSGYIYSSYITNGGYSGSYSGAYGESGGYTGSYSGAYGETVPPSVSPAVSPSVSPAVSPSASPAVSPSASPSASPSPSVSPSPSPTVSPSGTAATGYITGNYVRFRTGPSTSYSIINTYNQGQALTVIGTAGDWTQCMINNVIGYVYSQYVKLNSTATAAPVVTPAPTASGGTGESSSKEGYITGNNVRFRSAPSMTSSVLGEFYYGNTVIITGVSGEWTAVTYNGKSGYVYSSYVKEGTYTYTAPNSTPSATTQNPNGTATGADVANFATQFRGYNYTWGGASPSTGFDCSGLVYYCYQQYGYTLHRVASDQATDGVAVTGELQPGDILCFYSGSGYIGHAGIYLGNDLFIHAANSESGVIVTQLSGWYSDRGYEARRIIS